VTGRCKTGERVYFQMEKDGPVASLPRSWTDLALPDPFVEQSAGRAWFSFEGLVALRDLVDISAEKLHREGEDV